MSGVSFPAQDPNLMIVDVRLRGQQLACPHCDYRTRARYDTRPVPSWWRHLDFGRYRVEIRAGLRRLACPSSVLYMSCTTAADHVTMSVEGKDLIGIDQHQVRTWTAWHHTITACMFAQAFIAV